MFSITLANTYTRIYGFPKDEGDFEPRGQLCETHTPIHYNPSLKMIEHFGDTLPGNSGSPVINSSGNIVAVHFGSDFVDGRTVNLAVVIERNGNNITALRQAPNNMLTSSGSSPRRHQQNINAQQFMEIRGAGGLIFAW
ncbi:hypothetical protein F4813DRAFT_347931 [Daldinia decipiens]|uniref:uncharacterized protein n=1 Tax=Daldinia decipiens TaxID=326647 RepID=UPI0020C3D38F|nr:uncharacterized protein F4813DRAFT_347931 [Daldinia decipiens]KAI1661529.1 hypothetical protein F4813DRAFT_347931 [Daldinia decipiens]